MVRKGRSGEGAELDYARDVRPIAFLIEEQRFPRKGQSPQRFFTTSARPLPAAAGAREERAEVPLGHLGARLELAQAALDD